MATPEVTEAEATSSTNYDETPLLPPEAAVDLKVKLGTMANWRYLGTGPTFHRIGSRKIVYYPSDLRAYAAKGRRRSTSESAPRDSA